MNGKVIELTVDNIQKIILKKPKETSRHTDDAPEYISEVWYLDDDKLYRPIIRTPKLKVKYGAKQWSGEQSHKSSWSYCVGLYNYDIDPEIRHFHDSLKDYDKYVVSYWTTNKKTWNLQHQSKIKAKYFPALRRRTSDEDPYFTIKLINDNDGKVLTSIHDTGRNVMSSTDIGYGVYTDQFISPSFVLFNSSGIYPFWQAHQVVISPIERIFLDMCLLDNIAPPPPPPPSQHQHQHQHQPNNILGFFPGSVPSSASASVLSVTPEIRRVDPGALLGLIKKDDLLSAIGKLKSTKPNEIPKGVRNHITPEILQKQRDSIKKKAERHIMMESIKHVPIEGTTELTSKKLT